MKNRHILAKIWALIATPNIIILNGARQVGKSTLLRMIQKKLIEELLIQPSQIHSYDLEKVEDLGLIDNSVGLVLLPAGQNFHNHSVSSFGV